MIPRKLLFGALTPRVRMMFNTPRKRESRPKSALCSSRRNPCLGGVDLEYLNFPVFPSPKSSPFWRFLALFECVTQNSLINVVKSQALVTTSNLDRDITVSLWGRLDKDSRHGGQRVPEPRLSAYGRCDLGRVTGESGVSIT